MDHLCQPNFNFLISLFLIFYFFRPPTPPITPPQVLRPEKFGVSGEILEIDLEKNILKVKESETEKIYTILVDENTKITGPDGKELKIADLKVGRIISALSLEYIAKKEEFRTYQIFLSPPPPVFPGAGG